CADGKDDRQGFPAWRYGRGATGRGAGDGWLDGAAHAKRTAALVRLEPLLPQGARAAEQEQEGYRQARWCAASRLASEANGTASLRSRVRRRRGTAQSHAVDPAWLRQQVSEMRGWQPVSRFPESRRALP